MTRMAILAATLAVASCASGALTPVAIDTKNDACAHCRMVVSDTRTAAQLLAPGAEPLVFDDLGCLREYLSRGTPPPGAVVFVADHRTREWVAAAGAVYARVEGTATPMGSRLVAHRDRASRDADRIASDIAALDARQVFGAGDLFASGGGAR